MRKELTDTKHLREENKRLADLNDDLLTALERALDYIENLHVDEALAIIRQARAVITKTEAE